MIFIGIFKESDSNIISNYESEINLYCNQKLLIIQNEAELILRNAIQNKVYDYYMPTWYDRTYELLNSVNSDIRYFNNNFTLHVYIDTDLLNYNSEFTGANVSREVPNWIEYGHSSEKEYFGGDNQFDSYEGRNYLEEAMEEFNLKYADEGFVCNIVI